MEPTRFDLHIPTITILKVFTSIALAYGLYLLWPIVMLTGLSILIAVTLAPIEYRLMRRMPQWGAITLIASGLVIVVAGFFAGLMPILITQIGDVVANWPKVKGDVIHSFPIAKSVLNNPGLAVHELPKHLVTFGGMAIGGFSELILLLTLSIYFLIDGKRIYDWFLAFFKAETRAKMHRTGREMSEIISAYVAGQIITSTLVTVYAFTVLSLLKVPGALMLSVLAGVFDILPIVGFFLSTIPAMLLAFTVSTKAALGVLGLYLAYHAVENYFIVPKIYGDKLRLSTLTVLLSLLVGSMLFGILGAILILPVVASFPIIESIWLRKVLGSAVVEKHEAQDEALESKSA